MGEGFAGVTYYASSKVNELHDRKSDAKDGKRIHDRETLVDRKQK